MSQDTINRVLEVVQTERLKDTHHWSTLEITKGVGIGHTKVHQILQANDLQLHSFERFRVSNDLAFERTLEDIVGLYLEPQDNVMVLSIY